MSSVADVHVQRSALATDLVCLIWHRLWLDRVRRRCRRFGPSASVAGQVWAEASPKWQIADMATPLYGKTLVRLCESLDLIPLVALTTCSRGCSETYLTDAFSKRRRCVLYLLIEDPRGHAGPQVKLLPRSDEEVEQNLSNYCYQPGSIWIQRRAVRASGHCHDGEAHDFRRLRASNFGQTCV